MLTLGKLADMDDSTWLELEHPWERVKWARLYWQGKNGSATTAKAAAESMAMEENTYSAYERPPGDPATKRKSTPINHQRAIQFGKKFKVNWVWILTGEETPFERTEAQTRAVELMAALDEENQERVVGVVEDVIKRFG